MNYRKAECCHNCVHETDNLFQFHQRKINIFWTCDDYLNQRETRILLEILGKVVEGAHEEDEDVRSL